MVTHVRSRACLFTRLRMCMEGMYVFVCACVDVAVVSMGRDGIVVVWVNRCGVFHSSLTLQRRIQGGIACSVVSA